MNTPIIALIGAPNTGKSSLFNALTGARQRVGNYPGVTVEQKVGELRTPRGNLVTVMDLPGTYSLDPQSPDERVVADILYGRMHEMRRPDVILAVADATNLARTLGIVLALREFRIPMFLVMNMYDLASRRGLKADFRALEAELSIPVIPSIATSRDGIQGILGAIDRTLAAKNLHTQSPKAFPEQTSSVSVEALSNRQSEVDRILARVILKPASIDRITYQIDRLVLHPWMGGVILLLILFSMFQMVFSLATVPMGWIEAGVEFLSGSVKSIVPGGFLQSFLADGLIAGVGSVVVFLPQILILFLFILLLEGSGYMARAAFIMDRVMGAFGLPGRSFVPLLSSFACAIPGIMATRTIRNPRDRLLTMMIIPLMTCSARLPVYALFIGAFIPDRRVIGPINLQGLTFFGLFVVAVVSAMVVAYVLNSLAMPGVRSSFLMDLPTYKLPQPKYIGMHLWQRMVAFLKKAGTNILFISVGLWFLSTYPRPPADAIKPAIHYSLAGRIGHALEPIVKPLGFDWRIASGLVPGFAAREVMVSALGTVFAVEDTSETGASLLQDQIRGAWGLPTGLSLLAWYVFAPQCLATFAVLRRETQSRRWTIVTFVYLLLLAYIAAFTTYHIATLF